MVEPIKELREICIKNRGHDWGVVLNSFYRPISYYCVWGLLHTGISANKVTIISMFIGVLGSMFFLSQNGFFPLIGSVLVWIWYLGECCDGAVARYRHVKENKPMTNIGRYLDWLNVRVVSNTLFIVLTIAMYQATKSALLLSSGMAIIIVWFLASTLPGIAQTPHVARQSGPMAKVVSMLGKVTAGVRRKEPGQKVMKYAHISEIGGIRHTAHYILYILMRVDVLPFFLMAGALLELIFPGTLGLSWVFATYLLLGVIYTLFLFFEMLEEYGTSQ
jgi:phosphatidylglycerophosphate synthase